MIKHNNEPNPKYLMDINQFSDLHPDEFFAKYIRLSLPKDKVVQNKFAENKVHNTKFMKEIKIG